MILVFLLTTINALQFTSTSGECSAYVDMCDADSWCTTVETYVDICVNVFIDPLGYTTTTLPGIPLQDVAFAYATCSYFMEYNVSAAYVTAGAPGFVLHQYLPRTLSNVYECECDNTQGCDWVHATATWDAVAVCMNDPVGVCITHLEEVQEETEAKGVVWDYYAYIDMWLPVVPQASKDATCDLEMAFSMKGDDKLLYLGVAAVMGDDWVDDPYCMDRFKAEIGKIIMMMLAIGITVTFILTLAGSCAYCYCCQKKTKKVVEGNYEP